MKSFRNLILSLFLAAGVAGFTACSDGNMGPAGPQGPAGAPGAPGPKGDAGEAGKTADEIPRKYAFLETWGKADGMIACNDASLNMMDAFPGPTLTKLTSAATAVTPAIAVNAGTTTTGGDCLNTMFSGANPFVFTRTHGKTADNPEPDSSRRGTTSAPNPTQTTVTKIYSGGTIRVNLASGAPEFMGRELLFTRCGKGKRPTSANGLMGEYRIEITEEKERALRQGPATNNIIQPIPDTGTGGTLVSYDVSKRETKICVRFSAPGTVKCYVRTYMERRGTGADDTRQKESNGNPKFTVTEQIALYKNGLMQVAPMPVNGLLAGISASTPTADFPGSVFPGIATTFPGNIGAGLTITVASTFNLESAGKLCNLFNGGVKKCTGTNVVPQISGTCAAPSP